MQPNTCESLNVKTIPRRTFGHMDASVLKITTSVRLFVKRSLLAPLSDALQLESFAEIDPIYDDYIKLMILYWTNVK